MSFVQRSPEVEQMRIGAILYRLHAKLLHQMTGNMISRVRVGFDGLRILRDHPGHKFPQGDEEGSGAAPLRSWISSTMKSPLLM